MSFRSSCLTSSDQINNLQTRPLNLRINLGSKVQPQRKLREMNHSHYNWKIKTMMNKINQNWEIRNQILYFVYCKKKEHAIDEILKSEHVKTSNYLPDKSWRKPKSEKEETWKLEAFSMKSCCCSIVEEENRSEDIEIVGGEAKQLFKRIVPYRPQEKYPFLWILQVFIFLEIPDNSNLDFTWICCWIYLRNRCNIQRHNCRVEFGLWTCKFKKRFVK